MSDSKKIAYVAARNMEFLDRELQWSFFKKNENIRNNGDQIDEFQEKVILIGNTKNEEDFILNLNFQVWVMLYADETYKPLKTLNVLRNKKVKGILRPYPLIHTPFFGTKEKIEFDIKRIIKSFIFQYMLRNPIITLKTFFVSILFNFRILILILLHLCFRKPSYGLMLGYTNDFCKEICRKFNVESGKSILNLQTKALNDRIYTISFLGQKGKIWRQLALKNLKNLQSDKVFIEVRRNFSGREATAQNTLKNLQEYIEKMENSVYTLCPPGNYSRFTFRWMESIVLGSCPLELEVVFPDFLNSLKKVHASEESLTWSDKFEKIIGLKTEITLTKVDELRNLVIKENREINQILETS